MRGGPSVPDEGTHRCAGAVADTTTADLEAARRAHAAVVQYGDGVRFTYERAYTSSRDLVARLSQY